MSQSIPPPVRPLPGRLLALLLLPALLLGCGSGVDAENRAMRLGVTTSTYDTGLATQLAAAFEAETGHRVDVISGPTGKVLELARAGDLDVAIVHDKNGEEAFVSEGHAARREDLMWNEFLLVGPAADPAGIASVSPPQAMERILASGSVFISRADDSGTHRRELSLWGKAGGFTQWDRYVEAGVGMGRTLIMASEKQAYTISDRGTWLKFEQKVDLEVLVDGGEGMRNPYSALAVDPGKGEWILGSVADRFVDFLIGSSAQRIIGELTIDGERLFNPAR